MCEEGEGEGGGRVTWCDVITWLVRGGIRGGDRVERGVSGVT